MKLFYMSTVDDMNAVLILVVSRLGISYFAPYLVKMAENGTNLGLLNISLLKLIF